jgi:gamma-polyglutamate biosynthesis protein CapA
MDQRVSVALAGDLFAGNMAYSIGFGAASQFHRHGGEPWRRQLAGLVDAPDLFLVNLESPLIADEHGGDRICFAGCAEFAGFLSAIGVNLVSLANNHILEHGPAAFQSTVAIVEKAGIRPVGLLQGGRARVEVLLVKGLRIGVAAFSAVHRAGWSGRFAEFSEPNVRESIADMQHQGADFKIISLHWGDEYVDIPSPQQVKWARSFIDNGADVIVGHHPHVIQPFERYRHGLIFYSLGNFMFELLWSARVRQGLLVGLSLRKGKPIDFTVTPLCMQRNFAPIACPAPERVLRRLQRARARMETLASSSAVYYSHRYDRRRWRARQLNRVLMKIQQMKGLYRFSPESWRILRQKIGRHFKS